MPFTAEEKRKAVDRELAYRRFVYQGRIARGRMTKKQADEQIAIFEEIRDDYLEMEKDERLV